MNGANVPPLTAAARPAFVAIKGATDYSAVAPAHYGGKTVENFTSMCYNSSDRMKYKYIFYTTVWGV